MALVLGCFLVVGCAEQNYGEEVKLTPEESQRQLDDQIKKIEENQNMPPQPKQAAIANLKSRKEAGAAMSKGMANQGTGK